MERKDEMDIEDDLAVFLGKDDFGSVATIAGVDIDVLYDAEYVAADAEDIYAEQSGPAITGRTSELAAVSHDQAIIVYDRLNPTVGINYKAVDRKPDGTGITVIKLRAV
jgi:hypothetical protein